MPVTSPLSITWRGVTVGGSTVYPIAGPYIVERSYERFLLVFNVLVTADDYATLVTRSTTLEDTFGSRLGYGASDNNLVVDLDGNSFTYEHGTTIFNAESTITKSGDPSTDGPLSRLYTVQVQGELPEESGGGLREFEVIVSLDESRVHLVTMRGTYFGRSDGSGGRIDGYSQYESQFDGVASNYLNFVGDADDFELVQESYNIDRNPDSAGLPAPHKCSFTRQYREVVYNQTESQLNDDTIVNHRLSFSNTTQWRDNGREDVQRLNRVTATYDSGVDNETNPDIKDVVEETVIPYIRSKFQELYDPESYCLEEQRAGFDPAQLRLSVTLQFAFVPSDAADVKIIEAQESVQYRETRQLDYTFVHGGDELQAYVAPGFGIKERVWNRSVVCIGEQSAMSRLFAEGGGTGGGGEIGTWTNEIRGEQGLDSYPHEVQGEGWNTIASSSQVIPLWMGELNGERIEKTQLIESAVQRFSKKPSGGTSASAPAQ